MDMQLSYIIIYVDDPVKATAFYEKAFDMTTRFIHESNLYAEMESGQTTLAFAQYDMMDSNTGIQARKGQKNCFEIAFTTDSVDEAYTKALSAGAEAIKPPAVKPWGQTVAYVKDPFDTIVEICTPMG